MLVLESLATPVVWVLAFLTLGLIMSRWRRRQTSSRASWWAVLVGTLGLLGLSVRPCANLLTYSLEHRYSHPSPDVLRSLDIVVVLGAGTYSPWRFRTEAELNGPSYSRWYNGVLAFNSSDADLLVFCGGSSREEGKGEAEVMKAMAVYMGVPGDRILAETQSRNTMQNAACLAKLLPARRARRIGLVTSATHMWRAEKVFRKQFPDDTIIPVPVNYTCGPLLCGWKTFIPSVRALEKSTVALHEWIGILWYWVRY